MSTLIGRLMVGTRLDSSGFKNGAASGTRHLKAFDKRVNTLSRSINKSAATIGLRLGAAFAVGSAIQSAASTVSNFEQKVADLASISGKASSEMSGLVENAKNIGAVSAFSASEVLDLQTELAKLGNSEKEIISMSKAVGDFSIAVGSTAADAATLAGGTLKSFGKTAKETESLVSTLAVATTKSALDFNKLNTALPIVGTAADESGVSLERTVSLLGVLSDRNIDASTSGTALRNIFLDLKKEGLTYNQAMDKIRNSTDSLNTANDIFGKRGAVVATVLANSESAANRLQKSITGVDGALKEMTDKRLDTMQGKLTLLKSGFEGFILSVESGNGVISKFAKGVVEGFTGVVGAFTALNKGADYKQFLVALYGDEKDRNSVISHLDKVNKIQKEIESGARSKSGGFRSQRGGGLAGLRDIETGKDPLDKLIKNLNNEVKKTDKETTPKIITLSDKVKDLTEEMETLAEKYVLNGSKDQNLLDSIISKQAKIISLNSTLNETKDLISGFRTIAPTEQIQGQTLPTSIQSNLPEDKVKLSDQFLKSATEDSVNLRIANDELSKSYERLGNAIGDSLSQGANSFSEFASSALKSIQDVIAGEIKRFVATSIANSAIGAGPFGFLLAPAIGGIASGLFNTAINALTVPKLADGGVIKKPTYAMLGEYPGASSNPEIAAPESKLRDIFSGELLKNGSGHGNYYSKIMGEDIYVSNKRAEYTVGRTG